MRYVSRELDLEELERSASRPVQLACRRADKQVPERQAQAEDLGLARDSGASGLHLVAEGKEEIGRRTAASLLLIRETLIRRISVTDSLKLGVTTSATIALSAL